MAEVIGGLIFATIVGTVTSNAVGGKLLEDKVNRRTVCIQPPHSAVTTPLFILCYDNYRYYNLYYRYCNTILHLLGLLYIIGTFLSSVCVVNY